MAEVETPPAQDPIAAAPAKPGKTAAPKPKPKSKSKPKTGPSVTELICKVVGESKERGGMSLAAIKKALIAAGYDVEKNNARVKTALKNLVEKEILVHVKGTGASGSFKLNKKAESKKSGKRSAAAAGTKPNAAKNPGAKKSTAAGKTKTAAPKSKTSAPKSKTSAPKSKTAAPKSKTAAPKSKTSAPKSKPAPGKKSAPSKKSSGTKATKPAAAKKAAEKPSKPAKSTNKKKAAAKKAPKPSKK